MTDQTPKPLDNNSTALSPEWKDSIRRFLTNEARKLLGIPYHYSAEWTDFSQKPLELDCSEMIEGITHICKVPLPDGAQAQYNVTVSTPIALPGDFAFLGKGGDINKVYHVGMVLDQYNMIESRAFDPKASFETGKVIIRGRANWERYLPNFLGYRAHPKLA